MQGFQQDTMPESQKGKGERQRHHQRGGLRLTHMPPAYIKPIGKIAMATAQNTLCQRAVDPRMQTMTSVEAELPQAYRKHCHRLLKQR